MDFGSAVGNIANMLVPLFIHQNGTSSTMGLSSGPEGGATGSAI
ncbi:hypothetical protein [Speluncibacter jeojiensis]|uniref:Uncharacterized protein n=1 Tax=Speluncibacter jeojiensis TaxID=2710754 RepID=A0A9X4RGL0_9ACTN|nr:hypothetical protein [Rhodococcus sp. D2-41]MDG3014136.1 hypothetical protein [Corynebacteriales bacterium D3-21]